MWIQPGRHAVLLPHLRVISSGGPLGILQQQQEQHYWSPHWVKQQYSGRLPWQKKECGPQLLYIQALFYIQTCYPLA
jgi:hypothetical protein